MKRLVFTGLAAGLILIAPALADDHHSGGAPHATVAPHIGGPSTMNMPTHTSPSRMPGAPVHGSIIVHDTVAHGTRPAFHRSFHSSSHVTATYHGTHTHHWTSHRHVGTRHTSHVHAVVHTGVTSVVGTEHGVHVLRGSAGFGTVVYRHDGNGFGIRPANWNDRLHTFDSRFYRANVQAPHPFAYGSYARPQGWYYRRWGFGDRLPGIFWTPDYRIDSWWMFDLPAPPYDYEWVRYSDDALLVNTDSGDVLRAEYGVYSGGSAACP